MAELKPCPFCGGEAEIIVIEKGVKSIIRCKTHWCGFGRHSYNNGDTDENAARRLASAWNTRTEAPTKSTKVNEYRKKHRRCRTCKHYRKAIAIYGFCKAKQQQVDEDTLIYRFRGCFCRIYEPEEYKHG